MFARTALCARMMVSAAGADAKSSLPPTIPRAVSKLELESHEIIRVGLLRSRKYLAEPDGTTWGRRHPE
eukprot:6197950-Pleurochrysis_carterae.AAC.1